MPLAPQTVAPPIHPLLVGGPEYPFVKLERRRRELQPAGVTVIMPFTQSGSSGESK